MRESSRCRPGPNAAADGGRRAALSIAVLLTIGIALSWSQTGPVEAARRDAATAEVPSGGQSTGEVTSPIAIAAGEVMGGTDGGRMLAFAENALRQLQADPEHAGEWGQAALWVLGQALQNWSVLEHGPSAGDSLWALSERAERLIPAASPAFAAFFVLGRARYALETGRVDDVVRLLEDYASRQPGIEDYAIERAILLVGGLRLLGRFDAALRITNDALAQGDLLDLERADLLGVRSSIYISLGLAECAMDDLKQVESYASSNDDETLAFTVVVGRADCDLGRDRLDLVRARILTALEREWQPEHVAVLQMYLGLGWLEDDPEQSQRLLESVRSSALLPPSFREVVEFQLAQFAMDTGGPEPEWLGELVGSTHSSPRLTTWQTELLLQRGGSPSELQDQLERHGEAFDALLRAWNRVPDLPTGTSFLQYRERSRRLRGLMQLRMALDAGEAGRVAAFEDLMRAQAATSFARGLDAPPVTLARVREAFLEPGCGALVYLPTPVGSDLFAIDRDSIEHFVLPPDVELRTAIDGRW